MSKLRWAKDLVTLALIPADCSVLRTPTILISIYLTIFRDKKKALRFGDAARAIRSIPWANSHASMEFCVQDASSPAPFAIQ